jgi:undecaprenyl diphosphate synthase
MSDLSVPRHIGYIVDGNRRWAKSHGIPTYEGHLAGYNALKEVMTATFDAGVTYVSAYIFSTENWKRSEEEIGKLMGLVVRLLTSDLPMFRERNIRLRIIGSRHNLDKKLIKAIENAELETANNTSGVMGICFNYGGQLEIVDAIKQIINSGVESEAVTTDLVSQHLYCSEIPPVDLIVRTSGEQRISNFMLWRAAYSEMLFLDKMWPDMTNEDVSYIINNYNERSRRFGG